MKILKCKINYKHQAAILSKFSFFNLHFAIASIWSLYVLCVFYRMGSIFYNSIYQDGSAYSWLWCNYFYHTHRTL